MDIGEKRQKSIEDFEKVLPAERDTAYDEQGVLLSDLITRYAVHDGMIEPFDVKHLKPAGYELSIGRSFYIGGKKYSFDDSDPPKYIEIPPFEVAIIETKEILRLPRFMIARWNLRVEWAYKGLLWIGAAQVDPGYTGRLFCPIYNLSDRPAHLYPGNQIALIDFVKTSKYREGISKKYQKPSDRRRNIIEDYGCEDLRSAFITRAVERIDHAEDNVKNIEGRLTWFTTLVISVLAIAITLTLSQGQKGMRTIVPDNWWFWGLVAATIFSFLSSIVYFVSQNLNLVFSELPRSFWSGHIQKIKKRMAWEFRAAFLCVGLIAIVSGSAGYIVTRSIYEENDTKSSLQPDLINDLQERMIRLEEKLRTTKSPDEKN